MTDASVAERVDQIFRHESARIVATLMRLVGDVDIAEELAQDALLTAVERWPFSGVPEQPGAWLMLTAKNRAIDHLRREKNKGVKEKEISQMQSRDHEDARLEDEELIRDDQLRLIFTCSHPSLPKESQVALTLKLIAGLSTREIARAFLQSEATIAQRLVRAKRSIKELALPYEVPGPRELPNRLPAVLEVIYLIFNEGYMAATGERLVKEELCAEAIRLGRLLTNLLRDEPEVPALLALMEIQASRSATRVDANGAMILLGDQDRARWDHALIQTGLEHLEASLAKTYAAHGELGAHAIQAAIAACHARAPTYAETDWRTINQLYLRLYRLVPNPVIELNRAVAVAMVDGPREALAIVDHLARDAALRDYHLVASARADFLRQLGRNEEAAAEYQRALGLTSNAVEQDFLKKRIAECG